MLPPVSLLYKSLKFCKGRGAVHRSVKGLSLAAYIEVRSHQEEDVIRMAKISISDVYDGIHTTLREDPEILEMLGLAQDASPETLAVRIQKRRNPKELEPNNLPLISFFKIPGERGNSYLEYRFSVVFIIHTQDDVELAVRIADRIAELFDDRFMRGLKQVSFFKGQYITSAEDVSNPGNGYKYFTQIGFTIGIDEDE